MSTSEEEEPPGPIPRSEIAAICSEPDPETKGFKFIRTGYRIKDPTRSIPFYNCLGMTLLSSMDVAEFQITVYTLGYIEDSTEENIPSPTDIRARDYWALTRSATLELTYHWGTEKDPAFNYNIGGGHSHISIMVPDVRKATERLQKLGVVFSSTADDERSKGVALFIDPDGYIIAIYDRQTILDHL